MPRVPTLSLSACALRESIFSRLAGKLAKHGADGVPLHIGDTYLSPPPALLFDPTDTSLFRYGAPGGDASLVGALIERLRKKNRLSWVTPENVLITAGGTAALAAAARTLLDPGDECIVPSPHWPLIRGILTNAGAHPIEIPFSQLLYENPEHDPATLLGGALSPRTSTLYLTTPNNPDGKVLGENVLCLVADFAVRENLWVLSDEAYEDFSFGQPHTSVAALPGMRARTLTILSLSKSYALAGLRLGALVGPAEVIAAAKRVANHTLYNVADILQRAAALVVASPSTEAWLAETRATYLRARDLASSLLPVPHCVPEGATYLFVDLSRAIRPGESSLWPLVEELLEEGVSVSPGEQFGRGFETYVRLCFTAVPEDRLRVGMNRLRRVLEKRLG